MRENTDKNNSEYGQFSRSVLKTGRTPVWNQQWDLELDLCARLSTFAKWKCCSSQQVTFFKAKNKDASTALTAVALMFFVTLNMYVSIGELVTSS